jgi:hypothetical protein
VHDWKSSPLPIVMLRGWAYHEARHQPETPDATRPLRSVVARGVAAVRRLLAASGLPTSGEALPQGNRRDLDPG